MNWIMSLYRRYHIIFKVIPFILAILALKFLFHSLEWEFLTMNPLFTSIVAATTFLIGFLITGVISDYKESEKIPAEIAASIEVLYDESSIIIKNKKSETAKQFQNNLITFIEQLKDWFYRKTKTKNVFETLSSWNNAFATFEGETQAAFISRMKQEQNNLRKMITRIQVVRDTNFVHSAYVLVEVLSFFLVVGLVFVKIEPFYESLFFVALVSFVVLYMIILIKDLDDPFDYASYGETGTEVSLKPIHAMHERLKEYVGKK